MRILVTGGSGHLGRFLVEDLARRGHAVRVMSSSPSPRCARGAAAFEWVHANLASGTGLADAVSGSEVIFHLASDPRNTQRVDIDGTRLLLGHALALRVKHIVFVSITGIDQPGMRDYRYYRLKLEAEGIVRASGVPFSILRATQFHYFLDLLLGQVARIPLILPLPRDFRFQPVDEAELATRLTRCVADGPLGTLTDFAGPEILAIEEIAAIWAEAKGIPKRHMPIHLPGKLARAFRAGLNTNPLADRGSVSWRDWLARH